MRVCFVCLLALALAGGAHAQSRPATKDFPRNKVKDVKDGKDSKYETPQKTAADKVGGKTIKEWSGDLVSGDPSRRVTAVLAIAAFGDDAADFVPQLINRLDDPDVSPRVKACVALRYVGIHEKHVRDVVKALGQRLTGNTRDSQAVVRYEAAVTLSRFTDHAKPIIPALISGLTDGSSWEIRHACASVLWRAARDEKNGPDEKAVKAIIGRLKATSYPATYQEKLELITGLGSMGRPKSPQLLNEVIAVFQLYAHSTTVSRSLALWAYAGLVSMLDDPKKGEAALAGIARFLSRTHKPEHRVQACAALSAFAARSKKYVPDLLKMLDDKEDPIIVAAASTALSRICTVNDTKVVDRFLSHLKVYSLVRKDAKPLEKNNSLNKAASAVFALVGMKANTREVHDELDRIRENKEIDADLRRLIEKGQEYMRNPPKDKDKK